MSEITPPSNENHGSSLNHNLFWLTLVAGTISGGANYFILRFTHVFGLTWYILAPILYIVSILIIYIVTCSNWRENNRCPFRPYMKFSGTWIIAYFVVGTAIFYFGW